MYIFPKKIVSIMTIMQVIPALVATVTALAESLVVSLVMVTIALVIPYQQPIVVSRHLPARHPPILVAIIKTEMQRPAIAVIVIVTQMPATVPILKVNRHVLHALDQRVPVAIKMRDDSPSIYRIISIES